MTARMARRSEPLPSFEDWAALPDMKRRGRRAKGPCPACGGTDRFHVETGTGGQARVGCRSCIDGLSAVAKAAAFGNILHTAFPERFGPAHDPIPSRRTGSRPGSTRNARRAAASERPSDASAHSGADGWPTRVWEAATADPRAVAPVRVWLAGRGAWPPDRPLPPTVRWLARANAARLNVPGLVLPAGASGAAIYAFETGGRLAGLQWEPLSCDGERVAKRKTVRGSRMKGAAFRVPGPDGAAAPVHVAEGPVDALAVAAWRGRRAWAGGGTGGMAPLAPALAATGRPVVIEADGDGAGRTAAARLQDALLAAGAAAQLHYWPGCDPAEGLAEAWAERAAILEADGMDRREAETAAWRAMLPTDPDKEAPGRDWEPAGR